MDKAKAEIPPLFYPHFNILQQQRQRENGSLFFSIENKKCGGKNLQKFIFSTEKETLLLKKRASVEVSSVKPRTRKTLSRQISKS
ncbi:hypothetical protein ACX3PU_00450 [Chryseobacterium sp. A301]